MAAPAPLPLLFFFNDTATTEIYTLSLHDALPISSKYRRPFLIGVHRPIARACVQDRKSTRLNSSHRCISYAVFCLKKRMSNSGVSVVTQPLHPLFAYADIRRR